MNPIHSLAFIAAAGTQFLAAADLPITEASLPAILEGASKLGVTTILGIAVWYFKKQGELKDDAIGKRDAALEKKDAEFKEYLMNQSRSQTEITIQTKDVMLAVLEKLRGEETIRHKQITP